MHRRSYSFAVLLLSVSCLAGCAGGEGSNLPATVKVTGKITFQGEPVEGAHVTFGSTVKGPPAFGQTDAKGKFTLGTSWGEGAVPGPYVVTVLKETISGGMEFESEAEYQAYVKKNREAPPTRSIKDELPKKYKNRKTSGLEAEVLLGQDNVFEYDLKK